jgi:hypothetical protein
LANSSSQVQVQLPILSGGGSELNGLTINDDICLFVLLLPSSMVVQFRNARVKEKKKKWKFVSGANGKVQKFDT